MDRDRLRRSLAACRPADGDMGTVGACVRASGESKWVQRRRPSRVLRDAWVHVQHGGALSSTGGYRDRLRPPNPLGLPRPSLRCMCLRQNQPRGRRSVSRLAPQKVLIPLRPRADGSALGAPHRRTCAAADKRAMEAAPAALHLIIACRCNLVGRESSLNRDGTMTAGGVIPRHGLAIRPTGVIAAIAALLTRAAVARLAHEVVAFSF